MKYHLCFDYFVIIGDVVSVILFMLNIAFYLLTFLFHLYRISSDIRRIFFSFQNNPKDLDPSYKTDLDL